MRTKWAAAALGLTLAVTVAVASESAQQAGPAAAAAPRAEPAPPTHAILDGKTFHIEIADQTTQSCSREHALFHKGQFESMECRQYGFSRTTYEAQASGDSTAFKAVAPSPAEGTNTWTGVVRGNTIHGTLLWEKAGQKAILYHFKGTALALSKWPKDLQKQVGEK